MSLAVVTFAVTSVIFTRIVPAVLRGMPAANEFAFRALPAADTAPTYEYTIVLSFPENPM